MLKVLLRVRLRELLWVFTGAARKKKAQSKGVLLAFAALMLYALCSLGFLFWHVFDTIALPFRLLGLDWLYYAMAALMAFALMFVGSVFAAKSQLYEAKDNDLLLSMPLKPGHILLSRMFALWVLNVVLELVVAIPAAMAAPGLDGGGLVAYLLLFALLPLFTLAVSALFGWLLSVITVRLGNSSLLTVLLSVAFLGAYMVFAFRMNTMLTELAQNPNGAATALGAVAPLVWIGRAIAQGDRSGLAGAATLFMASFVLAYGLLAKTFVKIATDRRGRAKKKYTGQRSKAVSPRRALFRRELQRLLSSPAYILNGALGAIMALMATAVLLIKRNALFAMPMVDLLMPMLQPMAVVGLCFMAGTVLITAPSVSLEGRSLWIAQSLPVPAREILQAKLWLHLAVGLLPAFAASSVFAWVLKTTGLLLVCTLAIPAVFCLFTGLLGLAENLRHPSFDWVNETQAVKNGLSVMLTMFIGWGVLIAPVLVFVFWGDVIAPETIGLVFLAALLLACTLLYRWLMTRGAEIYGSL